MTKMNSISGVRCFVKDIAKTAKFYEEIGFRFGKQDDDYLICYVNWFWIEFCLQKSGQNIEQASGNNSLAISVTEIDEFYKMLVSKGLKPESEPQDKPSKKREFELLDPDGFRLVFFEK